MEVFYSDNAPELKLACKTLGIVHELSLLGVPQSNAVVERINLDVFEGVRTCLVCAGFPQCFWPFAAPHSCFLDNTSCYGADGKILEGGRNYARAHGKGEPKVSRLPFGCGVIFVPQDTKKLTHGKWEGSGEVGVIAGYGLNAGCHWDGKYLCWSLKELARLDMHEHASKYPFSLRSPHRTRRALLPDGGVVRFPLKEEYDRQTRSISGLFEPMSEKEREDKLNKDVLGHFERPEEHVDLGLPEELNDPIPKDEGKIVVGFPPPPSTELASGSSSPATYVVDPADMHGGLGYEWNEKGQRCRRDSVDRLYPVDKYGGCIVRRRQGLSRPDYIPSDVWRKELKPLDRLEWHKTMKEREKKEASKMAAIVAMTAARSIFTENDSYDNRVEEIVPASTPTSSHTVRACNPVYLNRKQGIADLFEDSNEVFVHEGSDSEASTSIAAPATLNDLDDESDPWESIGRSIEDEIGQEFNICATARLLPANLDGDYIPAMPFAAKSKEVPHRPKIVAFNSHSWITMNACVARPVGKKELLQSKGAQASMKAKWGSLRSKVVWDETNVREWSDVAKGAQDAGVEVNFGYLFGICVEKNSELPLGHPKRKFKGRVVFQGNRVTNQNWEAAIFQDLGSCPATMEAFKTADFYGLIPGHAVEIADAEQAYIQALLNGTPCWICLPPKARTAKMGGFRRPVVKLLRALYGHPDSGTMWEQHCDTHAKRGICARWRGVAFVLFSP